MFPNILTENQLKILPLLEPFNEGYYLAGGTAIALHIGHRKSIDFDLFTAGRIKIEVMILSLDESTKNKNTIIESSSNRNKKQEIESSR